MPIEGAFNDHPKPLQRPGALKAGPEGPQRGCGRGARLPGVRANEYRQGERIQDRVFRCFVGQFPYLPDNLATHHHSQAVALAASLPLVRLVVGAAKRLQLGPVHGFFDQGQGNGPARLPRLRPANRTKQAWRCHIRRISFLSAIHCSSHFTMLWGRSLRVFRGANYPRWQRPGRTRALASPPVFLTQKYSLPAPTRAPVAGLFFPTPTVLQWDNWDKWDNRRKRLPIGNLANRICIFTVGHDWDTLGHFVFRTFQAVRNATLTAARRCPASCSFGGFPVAHRPGHLSRPDLWSGSLSRGLKHSQRRSQSGAGA